MMDSIMTFLSENLVLSTLVLTFVLLLFVYRGNKKHLPPGPSGWPLIGAALELKSKDRTQDFNRLHKQYGDVFTLRVGSLVNIVVNGTEALQELIVKQADSLSERSPMFATSFSKGYGIAGASGQRWKEQRSFAIKTLRDFGFGKRSIQTPITEEVEVFIQKISDRKGAPFDVRQLVSVSITNIICSLVFGKRFEHDDEKFLYLLDTLNKLFNGGAVFNLRDIAMPWLRFLPGGITRSKQIGENFDKIAKFLDDEIKEHKRTFDEDNVRDYIDSFLVAQRVHGDSLPSYYSDLQLRESIRNLFSAGTETTATTIRWAILFLVIHQDVQGKMNDEIQNVIGGSTIPTLDQKTKLPYCEAVIAETQRLGDIAPTGVPHGVKYDVTWKGYVIPKGATILLNLSSVGMDPTLFPDPEKFKPERFLDENGKLSGQNKFFPFSLGRRICLGESLARAELFLFIVSIVQKFQLLPEIEGIPPKVEAVTGITRTPRNFKFRAVPRP